MNAENFCEHFATFADAPNGTERLRELILDLAVQGKLVPQDPNDEPAIRFLLSTDDDRGGDLGAKLLAGEANDASCYNRFSIPASWDWARIGQLGETQTGTTPKSGDHEAFGSDYPFIKPADILRDKVVYDNVGLSRTGVEKYGRVATAGSVLMVCIGTIGKCNVITRDCSFNQQINCITPLPQVDSSLLLYFLQSPYFQTEAWQRSTSTTISLLNKGNWESIPIPIPPFAEQRRIVEKVEQLLGLCDELAARQAAQREKRQRLVGATLDRLVSTRNPAEFPTHAHRLRNHFDQLFDTPTTIPQLRQTILQLAVQGKLVPQDPNDEPAEVLRLRVLGSLCDMIDDDQRRRIERLSDVSPDDGPFDLPPGWTWAKFPELGRFGRGKSRHRPRNEPKLYTNGIYPLVQTGDVARANGWITTHTGKYNEFGLEQSRLWPVGTMCITIAANIADSGRLSFEACIPDSVVGFIPAAEIQDASYFEFFMRTAKARLEDYAPSTAQKNINLGILDSVSIPFPPLAEQKRIVTKVTELLSLCDALEAKLTQAESASTQLLSAAVHQLLQKP